MYTSSIVTNLKVVRNSYPRRVGEHIYMRVTLESEVERGRSTEAIRCRAETSDSLFLQCRNRFVDNRFPRVGTVPLKPLRTVPVRVLEVRFGDRICVHDVWDDGLEAVSGESVREELYRRDGQGLGSTANIN